MIRPGVQVGGKVEFKGSSPLPSDRIRQAGISLVRTPPLFRLAGPSPGTRMSLTGEFTIAGVPPGRYVLRTPEIFAGWALESVRVGGRDLTDLPFDVRAEDLTGIIVTLTDRPAELSGSVRTASGDPDPNASVFLFPVDRSRWPDGRVMNRAFRTARIQPTGSFRVTNLISGEYFVAAAVDEAAVEWPDVAFLQRLAAGATRLRVEPGQLQTMSLTTAPFR
jgi:hypothetical protein